MRVVDTRGQLCPAPLIATKRALRDTPLGESFRILTDSKTSFNNVSRFLKDNNTEFVVGESDGIWTLTIIKSTTDLSEVKAEEYCTTDVPHFNKGNFIIAFSSDKMGEGDDKLGNLLIINFIKALKDLDAMPAKMVFYNRGVMLGSDDSPAFGHLQELEKMGVELFLCGTCINHYALEAKIKLGSVSNMFEIAQIMASAGNVLKP